MFILSFLCVQENIYNMIPLIIKSVIAAKDVPLIT